jgi:hypothetical protein
MNVLCRTYVLGPNPPGYLSTSCMSCSLRYALSFSRSSENISIKSIPWLRGIELGILVCNRDSQKPNVRVIWQLDGLGCRHYIDLVRKKIRIGDVRFSPVISPYLSCSESMKLHCLSSHWPMKPPQSSGQATNNRDGGGRKPESCRSRMT